MIYDKQSEATHEAFVNLHSSLKKHDIQDELSITDDVMYLKLDEHYEIKIYDNGNETYVAFLRDGKPITHWHLDYEDTYKEMVEIIQNPNKCTAEFEKARQQSKRATIISAIFFSLLGIAFVLLAIWGK